MEKKPAFGITLIHEFVDKAHAELDAMKELLSREPALVNSAGDLGSGDEETGLGAAAHMGRQHLKSLSSQKAETRI